MSRNMSVLKRIQLTKVNGLFKLRRRNRPGVPNLNGYTYNKDDFDRAITEYMRADGGLYLAPCTVDVSSFGDKTSLINDGIYVKFHNPKQIKYKFAQLVKWDDSYMIFKYCPTEKCRPYINMVTDDVCVNTRYQGELDRGKLVHISKIDMLDIPVIPFDMLGIDIYDYAKEVIR